MDAFSILFPRLHPEGHKFVIAFGVAALIAFLLWTPLGWAILVLAVWCVYFFRDPDRHTPVGDKLLISPADGVFSFVGPADPPPELLMQSGNYVRISVFMNVFNCHVNRSPVMGTVKQSIYRPGKFFNASLDKASEDNERQSLRLESQQFGDVGVVQIAGLVARRIVCDARIDKTLKAGERFGIIRFGSRVDIYVESRFAPLVTVGQTSVAGETVLVDSSANQTPRETEVR